MLRYYVDPNLSSIEPGQKIQVAIKPVLKDVNDLPENDKLLICSTKIEEKFEKLTGDDKNKVFSNKQANENIKLKCTIIRRREVCLYQEYQIFRNFPL